MKIVDKASIGRVTVHKQAMLRELRRRENAIAFAKQQEVQKEIDTKMRRKRRAELREKLRIENLQNSILVHGV